MMILSFYLVFVLLSLFHGYNQQSSSLTSYALVQNKTVTNLIGSINTMSMYGLDYVNCLYSCNRDSRCAAVDINQEAKSCRMFCFVIDSYFANSKENFIYYKTEFPTVNGLVYYWPISIDLSEWIQNVQAFPNGLGLSYGLNRFNDPQSSLVINNDFAYLDDGVYVAGDFSILAWVYTNSFANNATIFSAGDHNFFDNVAFGYSDGVTGQPFVVLINSGNSIRVVSPVAISTGQWTHLATTLSGTKLRIYIDGILTIESTVTGHVPRNVPRLLCYIGYSSLNSVSAIVAQFDQIKIYNRSLSASEVSIDRQGPSI